MVSLIFILTPIGFPEVHSWKQNENHAELLLEVSLAILKTIPGSRPESSKTAGSVPVKRV